MRRNGTDSNGGIPILHRILALLVIIGLIWLAILSITCAHTFKTLQLSLDHLQNDIVEIDEQVQIIQSSIVDLRDKLDALSDDVDALSEKVSRLEEHVYGNIQ